MKKTIYITAILIFFCFAFWSCEKRPFATIEIQGRVINFWTKAPEPTEIQLWVGGAQPGEKGTTNYGNYSTNTDGTFDVKSNAEWNGTDYTLLFIPNDGSGPFTKDFSVNRNKNLNVGDIIAGTVQTVFCRVQLNSVSGASINFTQIGSTPQTNFSAGTHTVFVANNVIFSGGSTSASYFYPIKYRLSTSATDSSIMVPLHPPSDSCSVTINY